MVARGTVTIVASLVIMVVIQWKMGLVTVVSMLPTILLQTQFFKWNRKLQAEI